MFSEVPDTYEVVNHVLTFGFDKLWRKNAASAAAATGGSMWLDLCTGTGDMAADLVPLSGGSVRIFGADFSRPMLEKARKKPSCGEVMFLASDVRSLPFPDGTFDLLTIAFSTRNLNIDRERLTSALREFIRVLKPGGSFFNLETSRPSNPFIDSLFRLYVRLSVRPLGSLISGSPRPYAYLSKTIPSFFGPEKFASIMEDAGFESVSFRKMTLGAAAIHTGMKGR